MKRVFVLLCIVNGKKRPNWEKVEAFGWKTARYIQTEYPWYRPSPSIHALCLHARQALESKSLPPGFWTEGSQESYNRKDRNTRHCHARRCSRKANIEDIFNTHLSYGDPLISSTMRSKIDCESVDLPEYVDLLASHSHSPLNLQDQGQNYQMQNDHGDSDTSNSEVESLMFSDESTESKISEDDFD